MMIKFEAWLNNTKENKKKTKMFGKKHVWRDVLIVLPVVSLHYVSTKVRLCPQNINPVKLQAAWSIICNDIATITTFKKGQLL